MPAQERVVPRLVRSQPESIHATYTLQFSKYVFKSCRELETCISIQYNNATFVITLQTQMHPILLLQLMKIHRHINTVVHRLIHGTCRGGIILSLNYF